MDNEDIALLCLRGLALHAAATSFPSGKIDFILTRADQFMKWLTNGLVDDRNKTSNA
jgi:hypothetical protein